MTGVSKWSGRAGLIGIAFFTIKGLAWLGVVALAAAEAAGL